MHYIKFMKVRYSTQDIFEVFAGFGLLYFGVFDNVIKKLSILDELHNQK